MIEENITDFRLVIEEKLKAKKSALDLTEANLKKFSVLREPSNNANNVENSKSKGMLLCPAQSNYGFYQFG